eukprot:Rmarinus@m.4061
MVSSRAADSALRLVIASTMFGALFYGIQMQTSSVNEAIDEYRTERRAFPAPPEKYTAKRSGSEVATPMMSSSDFDKMLALKFMINRAADGKQMPLLDWVDRGQGGHPGNPSYGGNFAPTKRPKNWEELQELADRERGISPAIPLDSPAGEKQ